MTSYPSVSLSERLRLGIEAARTGKEKEARAHLVAVLKQDPNNIPAMLWLAFVLPSPEDTIRLLKRVLVLDPENERAKAGIRWAKGRLGLAADQPDVTDNEAPPASTQTVLTSLDGSGEDAVDDSIRTQLFTDEEVQKKAKKGALAHRARRTINPFLSIIFMSSLIGLLAIGLGALAFVPPDTLAAWVPTPPHRPAKADIAIFAPAVAPVPSLPAWPDPLKTFTTASDILTTLVSSQSVEPELDKPASSIIPVAEVEPLSSPATISTLLAETHAATAPSALMGPRLPVRQPAYPGEKWIEVNVTTQEVTAWEGDVPVISFSASTGLPNTPTVLGEFNIYWKLESALMIGPNYYLPEVPYTMYFYGSYALHGTYWHNNFGQPMSHGCVNLETDNARKLFEWANPVIPSGQTQVVATANNPGTLVVVHQ